METYGVVTTCKGRLDHLRQSLPLVFQSSVKVTAMVVDYGCPQRAAAWCRRQHCGRIWTVEVFDNTDIFSRPRAKNIGAVRLPVSVLCFVDADCLLTPKWLEFVADAFENRNADMCLVSPMVDDASGTFAVRAQLFHAVRGYDEALLDWGYEDSDLYTRAYNYGAKIVTYDRAFVQMLPHDNDVRSEYHESKDLKATWERNRALAEDPARGRINALGYGIAKCLVRHR